MSATGSTSNFDLAIYNADNTLHTDDFNANMEKIDTALKGTATVTQNVDEVVLNINSTSVMLNPAQGTNNGQVGKAGVMTSMQATQLATLAEAYKNATQGITLYEDTASTNYVELSETANNYDHLIVVGEFTSEGSVAIKETVSVEFHPTADTRAFQFTATDLVTGNDPHQITHQDIWSLTEDGIEIELVSAQTATQQGATTTVIPNSTSIFTIVKVIGYGKKA